MMYDGWGGDSYYNNQGGLTNYILLMYPFYKLINGRITSNFVAGILESFPSEIILDTVNAAVLTLIYWCLIKILNVEDNKKKSLIAAFYHFFILFMPAEMRTYVIQIAFTAYVAPILLILLFYIMFQKHYQNILSASRRDIWILCILAFAICTWLESIAVGFGLTLGINFLFITFRDKKFYRSLWLVVGIAFFSGLLTMMAPSLRANRTIVYDDIPLTQAFITNISKLMRYLFINNTHAVVIIAAILSIKGFQSGWKKNFYYKIFSIVCLLTVFTLLPFLFNKYYNKPGLTNFYNHIFYIIQSYSLPAILLVAVILISVVFLCKEAKKPLILMLLMLVFSLLPICVTAQLAARVASIGYFMLVFISIGVFSEIIIEQKVLWKTFIISVYCLGIISVDKQILLCRRINNVTSMQQKLINTAVIEQKMGKWDYENDVLRLPVYQQDDVYKRGVTYQGDFHYPSFLSRYGLASETKVLFTNSDYYTIKVEKAGSRVAFHVTSILAKNNDKKFYYVFRDSNGSEVFNSITAVGKYWEFDCPAGIYDVYSFACTMAEDGVTVLSFEPIDQPISLKIA